MTKRRKNVRSDFVGSSSETEKFKSFLLDANDAVKHALLRGNSRGKFLFSERLLSALNWPKRAKHLSSITLTIFTRQIEFE
jgi:hypothetical protein